MSTNDNPLGTPVGAVRDDEDGSITVVYDSKLTHTRPSVEDWDNENSDELATAMAHAADVFGVLSR